MPNSVVLLSGVLLAAAGLGMWWLAARARARVTRASRMLHRTAAAIDELTLVRGAHEELIEQQRAAEASVDDTTELMRTAHRAIAGVPYAILEAIPATKDTSTTFRAIHENVVDKVADSISGFNKGFGHGIRASLQPERKATERPGAGESESEPTGTGDVPSSE